MVMTYDFRLTPSNGKLEVDSSTGKWEEKSALHPLVDPTGTVDSSTTGRLVFLGSEGTQIAILKGASWASEMGDEGDADCPGCKGSPNQRWILVQKA
jgi:hypothetical protein